MYDVELAVVKMKQATKRWEAEAVAEVKERAAAEVTLRGKPLPLSKVSITVTNHSLKR